MPDSLAVPAPITPELFLRFAAYLDVSPKTAETYARALRQFSGYLAQNGILYPQREDMLRFRDGLAATGHKPATIHIYLTAARLFFQWAASEGIYPDIARHIKSPRLDRYHKKDYLTQPQVKALLGSVCRDSLQGARDYAILALMVTGGLRTVEIGRANIEDLRDLPGGQVLYIQGKGKVEKTDFVRVPDPVGRAVGRYLQLRGAASGKEPLFISLSHNSSGQRMSTRSISGMVKQRLRAVGLDSPRLTAHSLRHTAVTLSLLAGKDITEVRQFARHADIATTLIYDHALEQARNSCAQAVADLVF